MATYRAVSTTARIPTAALLLAAAILGGCDLPTPPPVTADGRPVKYVTVDPIDLTEVTCVEALQTTEADYTQALGVLHTYYHTVGAFDKQLWAQSEIKNLAAARTWRYEGVTPPAAPAGESVEGAAEAALVEAVLAARRRWADALDSLARHYKATGRNFRLALIRNVQQRFDPVRTYSYYLHVEVPPANLRPTRFSQEAESLFEQALKIHKQGKPLPLLTDYSKQRRALGMFLELVRSYPDSTRIAESAYYIGDIYKEYFDEDIRAVQWYQRAWEWDPKVLKPARFQAAVVYDLRLAQPGKALPLYQQAIRHEQFNASNVQFATNRIKDLTGQR
ncbi:MAG: tetratricopeptide repeat protein [Planctomycetota bacterium]